MSTAADWHVGNAKYLEAAIAWLRACMEQFDGQHAEEDVPPPVTPVPTEESKSLWRHLRGREAENPPKTAGLLPSGRPNGAPQVAQAAAALEEAAAAVDPPPALPLLANRLGLSKFEQQVLILCLGMELDTGIAGLCARCQKDSGRPYPTFALAFTLFEDPTWDALSPERPLRYWRLVEITQPSAQPLTVSALRLDERILNYCKGLNYLDDRLVPLMSPLESTESPADLPASHRNVVDAIVARLKGAEQRYGPPVVQLLGNDSASKQLVATEAATSLGLSLYRLPATLLPAHAADLETLARLWQRETLLLPLGLYIDASLATAAEAGQAAPISSMLDRVEGAVFLDARESWPDLRKTCYSLEVAKPTVPEQAAAWQSALGAAAADNPGRLAAQFHLSYLEIGRIAQQVLAKTGNGTKAQTDAADAAKGAVTAEDPATLQQRLWEVCLASTRPQLDTLAERIEARMGWDDLVLPAAEMAMLRRIVAQVAQRPTVYETWGFAAKMNRGLGITALFSGDSGAGKTLAAEVLAHELGLSLYRIDLSAVVSKYIGETAKNLRRLFDAAENGGAILFFDEADALFGKRSEVKDSHDRYANIEINYLLQRMEAFRGLAILATNMKSALDPAFLRRLRFIVQFPFPGVAERRAIWQRVFPIEVPQKGLDYARLARLNVTGGLIHNIAVNAAFLAAQQNSAVTMPLVLEAARGEFRKMERPVNEAEFQWREPVPEVA